jgi:hypothetical protein
MTVRIHRGEHVSKVGLGNVRLECGVRETSGEQVSQHHGQRRPRKVDDAEHIATARRMKADGHTAKDIANFLGVSRATLYRYLAPGLAADRIGRD